ncbi:Alanine racemase [Vulgatibacter incomptus]|uniref:Alanine racemase n=1 Tax=Vulgatibacter incomptus TaxID=1391653 RepID=A0A0K1PCP8_9BACT|nr:Alanine racemase [Vulgatibacter incomptus]
MWDGRPLRPTIATIDLAALVHNLRQIRAVARDARVLAVVKANAYGHGAVPCARAIAAEGVAFLGVGLVEEGLELRAAGIDTPILVLDGAYADRFDLMLAERLTPVVFRKEQLEGLGAAARSLGLPAVAHLKLDTGMGRVGIQPDELSDFLDAARTHGVDLEGIATHLPNADVEGDPLTSRQMDQLAAAASAMRARGLDPRWIHHANSAALLSREDARGTLVRPGMLLYGSPPAEHLRSRIPLRPVMRLSTAVTHVKELPVGAPVSYGSRWIARRPSRIATLPVGYADGYDRLLSNVGEVLIGGKRVRIAGTVTMDQVMVDVTDVERVTVGDEAVLIGAQGDDEIRAEELARACGTIHYEIFCGIGPRVPRRFVGG